MQVYNSLSKQVEDFKPLQQNKIYWYLCGPTVYDHSHLGHARTYLTSDILRRILVDYFGYDVTLAMNITNIDDKIIDKAMAQKKDFSEIANFFENEFFDDMDALGVQKPNIVTRVTDYLPEMERFIQQLLDKGDAYLSNGSVYLDFQKYLEKGYQPPFRKPHKDDLISEDYLTEKKNPHDFVLWKKTKEGEPFWDSPFGPGRIGWHLECSTMAIEVFKEMTGGYLDIHSGGIDLVFPHHQNEIIQSQLYLGGEKPWTNYFLHTGHLNIKGQKMSKSLKNFITIKESLEKYTPNQLRMLFLLHQYNQQMDYSESSLEYAVNILNRFEKYFNTMENLLREKRSKFQWNEKEIILDKHFVQCQTEVDQYLRNDFQTLRVISILLKLLDDVFLYLGEEEIGERYLIEKIYQYLQKIFRIFGFQLEQKDMESEKYLKIILAIREEIREKKLYQLSDKIRNVYLKDCKIQDKKI